jgi:hypothetical protein
MTAKSVGIERDRQARPPFRSIRRKGPSGPLHEFMWVRPDFRKTSMHSLHVFLSPIWPLIVATQCIMRQIVDEPKGSNPGMGNWLYWVMGPPGSGPCWVQSLLFGTHYFKQLLSVIAERCQNGQYKWLAVGFFMGSPREMIFNRIGRSAFFAFDFF